MKMQQIPSPLLGLALGILGLCNALELMMPLHNMLFYSGCVIASVLVTMVTAKFLRHPRILWQELHHPILGAVPAAGCMVVLQLAQALHPLCPAGAEAVWLINIPISIALPCLFYSCRWRDPVMDERLPSWFLILGGLLLSAPTVPRPEWAFFANLLMYVGDAIFFAVLPAVLHRIISRPQTIDNAVRPVVAIVAAPVSLVIVTWLNSGHAWPMWGWPIYVLAASLTLWVYTMLPRLLRLPFSPAKASLTFPMAISAIATHKLAAFAPALRVLAIFETLVATAVILFVCYEFLKWYNAHQA